MSKIGYLVCSLFVLCAAISDKGPNLSRYIREISLDFRTLGDSREAKQILSQDFSFLASGGQCDVFASKDGKYVLKFFKNTPLPLPLAGYQKRKLAKLSRDISGYELAFERLQAETGLIFARLSTKAAFGCPLRVFDKLGCLHTFDAEKTCFVLQKRADSLAFPLSAEQIGSIYVLLQKQAEVQIEDTDPRQHKNIGMLEDRPIFLDPGKFTHNPEAKPAFSEKFEQWQNES